MKKIKSIIILILGIILGAVLTGGVAAYAYTQYASEIGYNKNGTQISVQEALNELYGRNTEIVVDNLEQKTDGVSFEGEYFYIYTPINLKWNAINEQNINYEKAIICHKIAGNNRNFTATLPFSLQGKILEVKLIREIGNSGWNPVTSASSGTNLNVDVNYGTPELSEYYFIVYVR